MRTVIVGDGTPASRESATDVGCAAVHHLLGKAWVWRFGAVMWGGKPHETPGGDPAGWHCRELREYFSTRNHTQQDDATLIGSVTRCTSRKRAFRFTQGRVTRWSHALPYQATVLANRTRHGARPVLPLVGA